MNLIISANEAPHHLPKLRDWFEHEWGEIDSFSGTNQNLIIPAPLLLVAGEKLLGGLAFTSAPLPDGEHGRQGESKGESKDESKDEREDGLWVNALLVLPEYREQGLASALIQRASLEASSVNVNEIFVYTDVPELYQKQGWLVVDDGKESKKNTVLKRAINADCA